MQIELLKNIKMFNSLFNWFKEDKKRKKIKAIASSFNEIVYSELYDLSDKTQIDKIVNEVINSNDQVDLIRGYKTLNFTAYHRLPLDKINIEKILIEVDDFAMKIKPETDRLKKVDTELKLNKTCNKIPENNIKTKQLIEESNLMKIELANNYLEKERLKLYMNLIATKAHIESGKEQFLKNEYSYLGGLYNLEKALKGPSTLEMRIELQNDAKKIFDLERELDIVENKEKALDNYFE